MANITSNTVYPMEVEHVREYYREKKALFGLIKWRTVERLETLGRALHLHVPALRAVDDVFINGDRWIRQEPTPTSREETV